VFHPIPR
ncbi:ATP synthase alpha/beta family, beta-barrel domain protein, partial [Vibrio parahaemolyticus V-223/04]